MNVALIGMKHGTVREAGALGGKTNGHYRFTLFHTAVEAAKWIKTHLKHNGQRYQVRVIPLAAVRDIEEKMYGSPKTGVVLAFEPPHSPQ